MSAIWGTYIGSLEDTGLGGRLENFESRRRIVTTGAASCIWGIPQIGVKASVRGVSI